MSEMKKEEKKLGAVLVVGGGIAGMQAAMDVAESGFKVYLAEKNSAIGGRMAQLDKTFPTNDCAMCIIAPKLIDMSSNDNIELVTRAQLEKIEGEAGNFTVHIRKFPRYVDEEKCNSCGKCAEVCTVTVPDEFNLGQTGRKAIYKLFPQAVPDTFSIEKAEVPRCRAACPIHTNVQGYISLIAQGKFAEAYQVNKEINPFPAICGRVCNHPCEEACLRNKIDKPVTITFLKRFATDYVAQHNLEEELEPFPPADLKLNTKVAIIGAGPSGLAAANDLAMLGHQVTVFESLPVAGGMMAVGIPSFRLPKEILDKEIDLIRKKGVHIRFNTKLGEDITLDDLFEQEYQAVYLAIGAHRGRKLSIEGESLPQVMDAVEFLKKINLGEDVRIPNKVVIIGGGSVAIDAARSALRRLVASQATVDAARSALRLGASQVTILYRRSKEEMPADEWEVGEAEEELGIKMEFLASPVRFLGDSSVEAVECIRMELGEPDSSGRRRPIPIENSEFTIPADMVLLAIGQAPDLGSLSKVEGLEITREGTIKSDEATLSTNIPGLFAGGDAVTGPTTVAEAIAAGKKAARSMHRYLQGEDLKKPFSWETKTRELPDLASEELPKTATSKWFEGKDKTRREIPRLSEEERIHSFDEVQLGFDEETAKEQAQRCLSCAICSECFECIKACDPQAIDHEQQEELIKLNVGSIILSGGYDAMHASIRGEYGYGRYPNVITGLELERILSASGPTQGHIVRPGDKKEPKRIAFIQCVGSRDITERGSGYCSSVCCVYATKQATIIKEHFPEMETTIFLIDLRAHGKGYEDYYIRAEREYGVRYIRSAVSSVKEMWQTKDLLLGYISPEGKPAEETFDLVVLSVGMEPSNAFAGLCDLFEVESNEYGFLKTNTFSPTETSREGIFVCGAIQEPKDIPDSVVQASATAAKAGELLAGARNTMVVEKEYPPEMAVNGEPPRVGVFVCHCGNNIAGVVDVQDVANYATQFDGVVHAEDILFTCSPDGLSKIKGAIETHQLNRVVVASCSPRTHEPLFRETLREAGLNRYLFEMANIRDQCAWVHSHQPQAATDKSKRLIPSAVAKARLLEPLQLITLENTQTGLVIGGGISGLTAALSLARQGFPVHLVEKEAELGGNFRHLRYTLQGDDPPQFLHALIDEAKNNELITLHLSSEVTELSGFVGNFKTKIKTPIETPPTPLSQREDGGISGGEFGQQLIEHGVVILATGAREYQPEEYCYATSEKVLTQRELEHRIADDNLQLSADSEVVMIQCVGCRNEDRTYCSRICCSMAIKNALKIKEENPAVNVYILYKDVRTYGFREKYYQQAREKGVIFIRYDDEHKPKVQEEDGKLEVTVFDPILKEDYTFEPSLVALSTAIISGSDNENISNMLMVPQGENGFFLEAHIKLRPVEFASDGIFVCGSAHWPKFVEESIVQAQAAAAKAATFLSKDNILVEGAITVVEEDKCAACLTCVRICPYSVPEINPETGVAEIAPAKCHGCGICVSECPAKALQLQQYKDNQVISMIDALLLE